VIDLTKEYEGKTPCSGKWVPIRITPVEDNHIFVSEELGSLKGLFSVWANNPYWLWGGIKEIRRKAPVITYKFVHTYRDMTSSVFDKVISGTNAINIIKLTFEDLKLICTEIIDV
jgi:hypothetical protein